jgi:hypothetical protein
VRHLTRLSLRALVALLPVWIVLALPLAARAQDAEVQRAPRARQASVATTRPLAPVATGVVDFAELSRRNALRLGIVFPVTPVLLENNEEMDEHSEPEGDVAGPTKSIANALMQQRPFAASPAAAQAFAGLDDIASVGSGGIYIPPDVSGAVGLTKVMQGSNNNYRILDKTTGAVLSTVSPASFWASVMTGESLTDPRMAYDPYNNRWIIATQTVTTSAGKILVAVSQTSDPQGAWFLYNFNTGLTVDFPILGFNKNWVSVSINTYDSGLSAFNRGINLLLNYPLARTGTGSSTIASLNVSSGFCVSPCVTYSATAETLYAIAHLSSSNATYAVDYVTGTPAAPVYHQGGAKTRPGGGWLDANNNIMPQSAPNNGVASCNPPCAAEAQDAFVRAASVYRNGHVYYAQTIELVAGSDIRTAAQWTRVDPLTGGFIDGGRLQDPTASATNGGKWYGNVHLSVNAAGDMLLGFTQFSSAQHPSAGYAVKLAGDAPGSIRTPAIYKPGEDYYHKTFSAVTTRNRWGDYSTVQVDPSDDTSIWALQEYGKTRTGTDDGATGSNSSKWATYWGKAALAGLTGTYFTVAASANAGGTLSPTGTVNVNQHDSQSFTMTPDLYFHVGDVKLDGVSVGAVTTYTLADVTANHTLAVTFSPDTFDIVASAGANGSISPSGTNAAPYGSNQLYTFTPAAHYHVANVLVDGVSVGAPATYTFTFVASAHTISVTFALDTFKITAGGVFNGSIAPPGATTVSYGGSQAYTITPAANYHINTVKVDNVSVGAVTNYLFSNVSANHAITATFVINQYTIAASAGTGGTIDPVGNVSVTALTDQGFDIAPDAGFRIADVVVDSASVGPVAHYDFFGVTRGHTIAAAFADSTAPTVTVLAPNGGEVLSGGAHANLTWSAADTAGVASVDLFLSRAGAAGPFDSIATHQANTGTYDWIVTGPATATAFLKVVARDAAGNTGSDVSDAAFAITTATGVNDGPVTAFALSPVRPNPARNASTVTFALPVAAHVHVGVLDVQGREVLVLADGDYGAGRHAAQIRTSAGNRALTPGLYFVRMITPGHTLVERFAVVQ